MRAWPCASAGGQAAGQSGVRDWEGLSLGAKEGLRHTCQSPRAWSVLREEPVCVERGCIKNKRGDVVEQGTPAARASGSVMKHRRTFHS